MSLSRPAIHAILNGTAFIFLVWAWMAIKGRGWEAARGRDEVRHRNLMIAALTTSTVFLVSYLDYHARVGHVPFWGDGWLKVVYFVILIPHVILAAAMVPMIAVTVIAAFRDRRETHMRWARWTWPIWVYVSVTGVVIYVMNDALRPA